jgi:hypothetical protein
MPRKAQGTTFVSDGAIYARVVIAPKKYTARSLAGIVAVDDEKTAGEWASTLQELVSCLRDLGRSADVLSSIETALRVGRDDNATAHDRVRKSLSKLRGESDEQKLERAPEKRGGMTFRKFAESWTKGELHPEYPDHVKEKKSAHDDASRLATHVYPVIGHVYNRETALTREALSKRLQDRGLIEKRTGGARLWDGVSLRERTLPAAG